MLQAHARLAEAAGVPAHAVRIADNGTILELDGDGLSVVGQIEAGTILVDGLSVGNVRDVVLRDRRHLASDGVLIVVATIAAETAEPLADPEIIVRGFDGPSDDPEMMLEQARAAVERVLEECQERRITEVHVVQQRLHDALAELTSRTTGKRPMVLPIVVEV
jgi:ribonuclease J